MEESKRERASDSVTNPDVVISVCDACGRYGAISSATLTCVGETTPPPRSKGAARPRAEVCAKRAVGKAA